MNQEQQDYIRFLNNTASGEIHIKHTGREGISLSAHRHTKHQMVYTLTGTLHIRTGNISHFIPEKHIAIIPAGLAHELSSNNKQIALLIIYCDVGANDCPDVWQALSVYNANAFAIENLRMIASAAPVINQESRPDLYNFAFSFFRLLPTVCSSGALPLQSLVVPGNSRLLPVLQYIGEHIGDDLTLEQVAQTLGFSVRNLSRLFQKEHLRFNTYLNHRRITRAIELFSGHDKTLQEVAYTVGFSSPGHFTRVFKQLLGVSPHTFFQSAK